VLLPLFLPQKQSHCLLGIPDLLKMPMAASSTLRFTGCWWGYWYKWWWCWHLGCCSHHHLDLQQGGHLVPG